MPVQQSFCHAKLPNAGLGNKLFVWAKAHLFAQFNGLPLVVTGWTQPQFGSFIRGGDLRLYWNYFARIDEVGRRARAQAHRSFERLCEPSVARMDVAPERAIYEFSTVPSWADYFGDIRAHRDEVRSALLAMLTPARMRELSQCADPVICVQVRLGDFRKLKPSEDFAKVGQVRTPFEYFRRIILGIRELKGADLPVEIMSDGKADDLAELLQLPGVRLAPKRSAIADLFVMSRSKVLVTSAGSTFGYWGGFLGEPAIILHPDHIHAPIRPDFINERSFEGGLVGPPNAWPEAFADVVRKI